MFFDTPTKASNKVTTIPSPIGGLNVRDSLAAMAETDAIVLRNWWPQPYGCSVRKGYRQWATGMPEQVSTLATWHQTDGTQKLFAVSDDSLWDITASGAVGAAAITGLTYPFWQWVNMVNTAGCHLIMVDGVDDGIIYNFEGFNRLTLGDGIVPYTWAGIDPQDAVMVTLHQSRLWAVEKDSSIGWFLPPDAIQGEFTQFDFGPNFSRGGFLQYLTTWTVDDGNGAEDHLVAVSSRGEAAVYSGTDPEDDTKWALSGVYFVGAPVRGFRSYTKAGGDLLLLTQQGVVSMATMLVSTKVNQANNPLTSNKIQFLISELISTYADLEGWELRYFPKENMVLVNVPSVTAGGNIQLAANQIIQAWTEFHSMDAVCWWTYDSNPMFGDYSGNVMMAFDGTSDNVLLDGTGGVGIIANAQQAYTYLKELATQKQLSMYRPTFIVNNEITLSSAILYDFATNDLTVPGAPPAGIDSLWGVGLWGTAVWGGGDVVQKRWIQAAGLGVAASLRLVTQTQGDVLWVATDFSYIGGPGLL